MTLPLLLLPLLPLLSVAVPRWALGFLPAAQVCAFLAEEQHQCSWQEIDQKGQKLRPWLKASRHATHCLYIFLP